MIHPVLTWGSGSITTAVVDGPHWSYRARGRPQRIYPPRARGDDVWVQTGDLRTNDPATDTWEGEAT